MALVHEFVAINKKASAFDSYSKADAVKIPDELLLCLVDSFTWVDTCWNGTYKKEGLNYYGYSIIDGGSLTKFRDIVKSWLCLFGNAPDQFTIRGNYLYDEDEYEQIELRKREVLALLNDLKDACDKAIAENKPLLHIGV